MVKYLVCSVNSREPFFCFFLFFRVRHGFCVFQYKAFCLFLDRFIVAKGGDFRAGATVAAVAGIDGGAANSRTMRITSRFYVVITMEG